MEYLEIGVKTRTLESRKGAAPEKIKTGDEPTHLATGGRARNEFSRLLQVVLRLEEDGGRQIV